MKNGNFNGRWWFHPFRASIGDTKKLHHIMLCKILSPRCEYNEIQTGPDEKAQKRFQTKVKLREQSKSHKVTKLEVIVDITSKLHDYMWRQRLLWLWLRHFDETVGKSWEVESFCRTPFTCGSVEKLTRTKRGLVWEGSRKKAGGGGERVRRTGRAAAAARQDRPTIQTTCSCIFL